MSTSLNNNRKRHMRYSASVHWENLRQNKIYHWKTNKKERLHNIRLKGKWQMIPRFYCNFTPGRELAIPKLQVLIPTHFKKSWKGGCSLEVLSDNEVQCPETDTVSWKVNIFNSERNSFKCNSWNNIMSFTYLPKLLDLLLILNCLYIQSRRLSSENVK